MAVPLKGSWTTRWYRTKANTTYTQGNCVDTDGTDIVEATSSSGGFLGIVKATKASANNNNRIPVMVPKGRGCTFSITGASLTTAIEGRALDYSDATTIGTGTTYKPLRVEKVISATEAEVSAKDPIA